MSTVIATSVLPDSTANDTLTIGATGDSVVIGGNLLTMNTLQDAGGNAIFVSDGSGTITSAPNFPGALKLISSQTASGSASLAFTSGLDSTYDVYCFKFVNINPTTDNTSFDFQASTTGAAPYGVQTTTCTFCAQHNEADNSYDLAYRADKDLVQSTDYQPLGYFVGNGSDECCAGELYLFKPSDTTYAKQFYARVQTYSGTDYAFDCFTGGYFNTASAISAIDFKCAGGNFDGIIALYGISKS